MKDSMRLLDCKNVDITVNNKANAECNVKAKYPLELATDFDNECFNYNNNGTEKDRLVLKEENVALEHDSVEIVHKCEEKEDGYKDTIEKVKLIQNNLSVSSEEIHCKRRRGRPRVLLRKTHPCDVCARVFSRKTHLTTHLRIHSNEKPFRCSVCLKQFRDKSVLINHIRVHTQERPYGCNVCGRMFTQRGNMERHAKQHTGERPFACSVCTNDFATKTHLERHFRIHSNAKPFTCALCNKSFRQKPHLIRHILVHSKEKPYSCNLCAKRFRQEQHLTRHKTAHIKGLITNILSKRCIVNSASSKAI